jgi:hypothetical protein
LEQVPTEFVESSIKQIIALAISSPKASYRCGGDDSEKPPTGGQEVRPCTAGCVQGDEGKAPDRQIANNQQPVNMSRKKNKGLQRKIVHVWKTLAQRSREHSPVVESPA